MARDWDAIGSDYRATRMTLRELEEKHGVSRQSILRAAKKHGWSRDLTIEVNAQTKALLINNGTDSACQQDAIKAAAELNKEIILKHRGYLRRMSDLRDVLMTDLEKDASDIESATVKRGMMIDELRRLADVDEKIRKGEREAYGISDEKEASGAKEIDALLRKINGVGA